MKHLLLLLLLCLGLALIALLLQILDQVYLGLLQFGKVIILMLLDLLLKENEVVLCWCKGKSLQLVLTG